MTVKATFLLAVCVQPLFITVFAHWDPFLISIFHQNNTRYCNTVGIYVPIKRILFLYQEAVRAAEPAGEEV